MTVRRFEDLEVWQFSHRLVLDVYTLTRSFPDEERYGITSQLRRSAVSVPANIAEGFRRHSAKEKSRFYNIAHASLEETRYYLILARDLQFIDCNEPRLLEACERIGRMLNGLTKSAVDAH